MAEPQTQEIQLQMRRSDLLNLPEQKLAFGYDLRTYEPGDEVSLAQMLTVAFAEDWSVERVMKDLVETDFVKETFVICSGISIVGTASAASGNNGPTTGYVHWVGVHPDHRGAKLGWSATVATLHAFVRLGYDDVVLNTQDFRLPALKTYLSLGFKPDHICPTHADRWQTIYDQLGVNPRS